MNKAFTIKIRNVADQTYSIVIRSKNDEDWRILQTLKNGLTDAIAWLDAIESMDWCPIYTADLLGRKQITEVSK